MKILATLILFIFSSLIGVSQLDQIVIEEYAVHTGMVGNADLTGFTTYRVYAQLYDQYDFVSAVFAIEGCHPLSIRSNGGVFYNHSLAGVLGTELNPDVMFLFPEAEFDSYATIGIEGFDYCFTSNVQHAFNDDVNPLLDTFGNAAGGGDFYSDDGAWFVLNQGCNGFPQNSDNQVLLFQVTTDGELEFDINVRVLDEGYSDAQIDYVSSGNVGCFFTDEIDGTSLGLTTNIYGCMDDEACNFNTDAIYDSGLCCFDNCVEFVLTDLGNDGWGGTTYSIYDAISNDEITSGTLINGHFQNQLQCLPDGCYRLDFNYVSEEEEIGLEVIVGDDILQIDGGSDNLDNSYYFFVNSTCPFDIYGCIDPNNCNYNPFANLDDGSCDVYGCTYQYACNYLEEASCDDGSCIPSGCTDMAACNFDPDAGCDDGSCLGPISGCIDETACNYDALAECDDGSCIPQGCTNIEYCNYNPLAGCDDGSCGIFGCTDETACNFNPQAACDTGDCIYLGDCLPGCTDPIADNYDSNANVDNGSCMWGGCTNPIAFNFNLDATYNDGSCLYTCSSETIILDLSDSGDNGWNGATYAIFDDEGSLLTLGNLDNALAGNGTSSGIVGLCLEPGNYSISVGGGFLDEEISWSVICNGDTPVSGGAPVENIPFTVEPDDCLGGCSNPDAENYSPMVDYDIGNCVFFGCTDVFATNYDIEATADDQSCTYDYSGYVFNDLNLNGTYQEGFDIPLPLFTVTLEPMGIQVITDQSGFFSFSDLPVGEYTIFNELSTTFPIQVTPNEQLVNTLIYDPEAIIEFALSAIETYNEVEVFLYPGFGGLLCSTPNDFDVSFRNLGNETISGIIEIEYDETWEGFTEVSPLDSVVSNTLYMSFQDLQPMEIRNESFILNSPSFVFMGIVLNTTARVYSVEDEEILSFGEKELSQVLTCAYDPNDKQVFPSGYEEPHFVLNDTELEYLVRFQNVGNAPATDVVIKDTLDINLDIETFHLITNSHNVLTTIDPDTREVTFLFENIMLPDTAADLEGSNGFVSYKITPNPDLPEETLIENTAYIYFDSNPAVITNTTWNTIFLCDGLSNFNILSSEICLGEELQATNEHDYIEEYSWAYDGIISGLDSIISLVPSSVGQFEISLNSSNPLCSETFATTVTVNPLPTAEFTEAGAELTASIASSYQWYLNGEEIEGATEMTHTVLENGNYSVELTNEFGCSSVSDELFVSVIGVDEQSQNKAVLYPNPMINNSMLIFDQIGDYQIDIYNFSGHLVRSFEIKGNDKTTIEKNNLACGVYQISVIQHGQLVKQLPLVVK